MKITVLGSGGFGYPLGFCECKYCNKARMLGGKNIRKRASLLIDDKILIDLTPDTQTAMSMYNKNMGDVKCLLQTHTHVDHFDMNIFTTFDYKYNLDRKDTFNIIASKLCHDDINAKANLFDRMPMNDIEYLKKIKLNPIVLDHGNELMIDGYTIKAIHCRHHEAIGAQLYLIKKGGKTVFYATDTPMIDDTALSELKGEKIDCMFLDEAFGYNDYEFGHLNINTFNGYVDILKKNKLLNKNAQIYSTHMTHDGNPLHDELEKELNKTGCHASYDGMEIEL